jgi:hypothetical protein
MDNRERANGTTSHLESEEIVAVTISAQSRQIGNHDAVNGKVALTSAVVKEKKVKINKKVGKGKSRVMNLENRYVFICVMFRHKCSDIYGSPVAYCLHDYTSGHHPLCCNWICEWNFFLP